MAELPARLDHPPRVGARSLGWSVAVLLLLAYGLPYSEPLLMGLFPDSPRPVYLQEPMADLLWQHMGLVVVSSAVAVIVGTA
ncbi:MAG: hypothetical protein RJA69_165, partial [Pseudomonadota bacterium]